MSNTRDDKLLDHGLRHVAFIMDGNGRWSKQRGKPRSFGHRSGAKALQAIIEAAADLHIPMVTFYSFSTENWRRSPSEISDLMGLLRHYLIHEIEVFHQGGAKLCVIGERDGLDAKLVELIEKAEEKTKNNQKIHVNMAINYGGRLDMVQAARKLAIEVSEGNLNVHDIDEKSLSDALWTKGMPDPDLLIRTSGEMRISNFLLWQLAYTELYFTDCLWPDFDRTALVEAIQSYLARERRYGGRT